jgi:hypothetical protein
MTMKGRRVDTLQAWPATVRGESVEHTILRTTMRRNDTCLETRFIPLDQDRSVALAALWVWRR